MKKTVKTFFKVMLVTAAIVTGIALSFICMLLWAPLLIPSDSLPYVNETSSDRDNCITYLLTYEYDNTMQKGVVVEFLKTYLEDMEG